LETKENEKPKRQQVLYGCQDLRQRHLGATSVFKSFHPGQKVKETD